jgi:hypothetical protein
VLGVGAVSSLRTQLGDGEEEGLSESVGPRLSTPPVRGWAAGEDVSAGWRTGADGGGEREDG